MYVVDEYKDRFKLNSLDTVCPYTDETSGKNIVKLLSKERSWSSGGLLTQGVG